MQTSLIINATTPDGNATKTVTDVNSTVSGGICYEYGRLLNATTTNTFQGVNRVDRESLDINKVTPTLTVNTGSVTVSDIDDHIDQNGEPYFFDVNYDGDGTLSVDLFPVIENQDGMLTVFITPNKKLGFWKIEQSPLPSSVTTITIRASETDTCNAVSTTVTLNYS